MMANIFSRSYRKIIMVAVVLLLPWMFYSCSNAVSVNYNNPLDPRGTNYVPAPPAPPQNLTATVTGDTGVALSWVDTVRTISGFYIERKIGNAGNISRIGTTKVGTDTFFDPVILVADTTYYYRVAAFKNGSQSQYTPQVTASIAFPAPSKPVVTALSSGSLKITWLYDENDQSGFVLEKSLNGGQFYKVTTLGKDVESYIDDDVDTTDSYSYRVAAVEYDGNYGPLSAATTVEYTASSANIIGTVNLGSGVNSIVFSPDGSMFAAAGTALYLKVWKTNGLTLLYDLRNGTQGGNPGWPFQVAFSPDGKLLASDADGTDNDKVYVWRLSDGSLMNTISGPGGMDARSLAISPNDRYVLTGDFSGDIRFWTTEGDSLIRTINAFTQSTDVDLLRFSRDGQRLIAASYGFPGPTDEGIKIWNTNDWSLINHFNGFQGEFYSVSTDDKYYTVNGTVGTLTTGNSISALSGFQLGQACLTFNDELLVGKEYSGPIVVGDAADGSILFTKSMSAPTGTYPALACSPTSLVFATAGPNIGEIDLWTIHQAWRSK